MLALDNKHQGSDCLYGNEKQNLLSSRIFVELNKTSGQGVSLEIMAIVATTPHFERSFVQGLMS